MTSLFTIFKPLPYQEEITDQKAVKEAFTHWRWRVFYSMFIGYALYYFTRFSFTFAMPALMKDLGLDKGQLGILASVMAISYGLSKFVSGVFGDRSNPRYLMGVGLILTGVFNILFGLSSSLLMFCVFWGLNGWFQGFGWPGCAKLLTHWYSQSERGRWWSLWNTSHNVGGALIPIITAFFAQYYGWRSAMIFPGVICILGGFFLINRLCDTPQSMGLPSIEKYRDDYPSEKSRDSKEPFELSVKEILFKYVLNNPYLWLLATSYFFVYIIRSAVSHWTVLYLVEAKDYSQIGAGSTIVWFEAGGFFGSLASGWGSDKIFKGRRGPICILFSFLVSIALFTFWKIPYASTLLDSSLLFIIGFLIFGPQMLIGMAATELSHKKAAATASGFTGWIAYIGAAVAGYPLGKIAQDFGWDGFFMAITACGFASSLLLFPLWTVRSREDGIFGTSKSKTEASCEPIPIEMTTHVESA